jgi:hypothetical protein
VSGETERNVSGWTTDTLKELGDERDRHAFAMRQAQDKFEAERDRRYSEVNTEREKALKIKETADLAALSLAREIQDYKDEKANNLRAQIEGERGQYATQGDLKAAVEKIEATTAPLLGWVAAQQGRREIQTEVKSQSNFTLSQFIAGAGVLLLALIELHRSGVI